VLLIILCHIVYQYNLPRVSYDPIPENSLFDRFVDRLGEIRHHSNSNVIEELIGGTQISDRTEIPMVDMLDHLISQTDIVGAPPIIQEFVTRMIELRSLLFRIRTDNIDLTSYNLSTTFLDVGTSTESILRGNLDRTSELINQMKVLDLPLDLFLKDETFYELHDLLRLTIELL
jgi:hypothetical protein